MIDTLFSINGKIVPESEALVPVTDRGFFIWRRTFRSAACVWPETFSSGGSPRTPRRRRARAALRSRARFGRVAGLDEFGGGGGRVSRGQDSPHCDARQRASRTVAQRALESFYSHHGDAPRSPAGRGASEGRERHHLEYSQAGSRRRRRAGNQLNYIEQILARREADLAGANEALLLTNAGLLCEGSASNVSIVRGGKLVIPDPKLSRRIAGNPLQLTAIEAARNLRIETLYACHQSLGSGQRGRSLSERIDARDFAAHKSGRLSGRRRPNRTDHHEDYSGVQENR